MLCGGARAITAPFSVSFSVSGGTVCLSSPGSLSRGLLCDAGNRSTDSGVAVFIVLQDLCGNRSWVAFDTGALVDVIVCEGSPFKDRDGMCLHSTLDAQTLSPGNGGTPFRRAIEEGLLDPKRVIQIGIRGTMYDGEDIEFGRSQGVTILMIEDLMARGVEDVMAQARDVVGDQPTYCSFDIDFIDPAFAPGTGTPEIGGPNTFTAQQVVRELRGLNLIGADLVEVSPPFDPSGGTAWVGVSIMFELLCVLAEAKAKQG